MRAAKIDKSNHNESLMKYYDKTFYRPRTDSVEVYSKINGLKNTGGGMDRPNNKILKNSNEYIYDPLADIFKRCFEQGIYQIISRND